MNVFKDYASYYDLLYKNKDYTAEANYIDSLIRQYVPGAKTILNLGCGTGAHDFILTGLGYQVTGVDLSPEMIDIAKKKSTGNKNLNFMAGDARNIELGKKFEVVISLFHVLSYQVSNDDLAKIFQTVEKHLKKGGIFIFDCWYGPGVLTESPAVRYRILENDEIKIHRIAEPEIHIDENYVDVNYTILVIDKKHQSFYEIKETHKMRYFFEPEIIQLASRFGYKVQRIADNIFSNSWNALYLCSS